jgi:hypothetical protein
MMKKGASALLVVSIALMATAYAAGPLAGAFALQGGTQRALGYLQASPSTGEPGSWTLDFWMTPKGRTAPIAAYDLDMTKYLHVIVISDDFKTFIHEHPAYSPSGHFVHAQLLPAPGLYHVYADGRPTGMGQQVFRFDLANGNAPAAPRDLSERRPVSHVDGYAVALSSLTLRAGSESQITVRITKGGQPATDLHPYLMAPAHAVFIDADDLSYVHVHPVMLPASSAMNSGDAMVYQSNDASVPAEMLLHVSVMERGTYKLWFQFRGGSSLHVATFVLTAI